MSAELNPRLSSEVKQLAQELGPPPRRGMTYLFRGSFHEFLHPPPNQIPFLHGLRAIAILLVVAFHFSEHFVAARGENTFSRLPFVSNGWAGVDLFFVLSGFFIGGQLWKELWRDGTISIRRFIVRRGLRIWPLYFTVFLFTLVFMPTYAATKSYGWSDLVFLSNYLPHGIVQGSWSLSTEEQFYLLTPLLLLLFGARRSHRSSLTILWALFALLPVVRAVTWLHITGSLHTHDADLFSKHLYYKLHTHADGLILGLILSHQWVSRERPRISKRSAGGLVIGGAVAFFVARLLQHEILIFTGLALLFGAVAWAGLASRVPLFTHRIFFWISRLSFGMYLNHVYLERAMLPGLLRSSSLLSLAPALTQLLGTMLATVVSAMIALVTFCLIEHPALNLRVHLLEPLQAGSQPVRHVPSQSTIA